MRRLVIITLLASVLHHCLGQGQTSDSSQIEIEVNRMLAAMQGKFSVYPYAEGFAKYGDAAVPVLISAYHEAPVEKRWALAACLSKIPNQESLDFLKLIIQTHIDRKSTLIAIRRYPVQGEDRIAPLLIELQSNDAYYYEAAERLRKMIFRNPAFAGQLVNALVDEESSVPTNRRIYHILEFPSGYQRNWPNRTPDGRLTPASENSFWRSWWERNQDKEIYYWLMESLYLSSGKRRSSALQTLSVLNDPRAIPHYLSALDDEKFGTRYWAVICLKKMDGSYPEAGYRSETFTEEEAIIIPQLRSKFANAALEASPPEAK